MTATLLVGFSKLLSVFYFRIIPIVLLALISFGIWCLIEKLRGQLGKHTSEVTSAALGFSFAGTALGIMISGSREPAMQAAIPGLIGLVSAFSAYAYAKQSLNQYRPFAVPIIATLSMTLVFGAYFGSALREDRETYERAQAQRAAMLTSVSAARTDICKRVAIKAVSDKVDPIQALPSFCKDELGFID